MENEREISEELNQISTLLAGMNKSLPYRLPAGYFEDVSSNILTTVRKQQEGILDQLSKQSLFRMPTGYFDNLADNVLGRIKSQEAELEISSPLYGEIKGINVFEVPEGYFDKLAGSVMSKVSANEEPLKELRTLSPMLYTVHGETTYLAPAGYFDELPGKILDTCMPAKIITMKKRSPFIRYAVAAVFTGMVALGAIKFIHPVNTVSARSESAMNIDKELDKVADEDIIKYLENNGENIDLASVTNTTDANEMPNQEDYLNDDKTLDKYLDNADQKNLNN